MTNSQRIALEQSKLRQRALELSALDELTDEQRAEMDTIEKRSADLERQSRMAILAEQEAMETPTPEHDADMTPEQREIDGLLQRSEILTYLTAAAHGKAVDGAERELRQAILGTGADDTQMPVDMLLPLETRADASTDVADAIQHNQSSIIGRVFAETAGAFMGIGRPTVPVGEQTYYTLTGGTTADIRDDGVAKDADAATFSSKSVEPTRLTARYLFGVETTARIRGFEDALRADLRMVLGDKLDALALNGQAAVTNVSPEIFGLIPSLTDPNNPASQAGWRDFFDIFTSRVDGKYSMDARNVRVLCNPETWAFGVALQIAVSGELMQAQLPPSRFRTSANMPATNSGIATVLSHTASMRIGFVQPTWRGISLIRDMYTKAAEGQVALTAIMLSGAAMVDAAQYGRHEVKLTL